MNVLVLVTDYPRPEGTHAYMFVHVRNKYYLENGIFPTVINFASKTCYEIDGIRVITKKQYADEKKSYDILISHASNVRNHFLFIKKYECYFKKIIFFFHGQEILRFRDAYPKPYEYMGGQSVFKTMLRNRYDDLKIVIWAHYYKKLQEKSCFVFVSNWIKKQFSKNLNIPNLKNQFVINNSVGSIFERYSYERDCIKEYDFITIRSNLDGSKYGIDIVCRYAHNNPDLKFLIIGKGKFFDYNILPPNVTLVKETLNHEQMISYLNKSKIGLLPTREDTQGVMTCEMITFGIPVITSNIEVCHEFFDNLDNVYLIPNDVDVDLHKYIDEWNNIKNVKKITNFYAEKTISKEIALIKRLYHDKS